MIDPQQAAVEAQPEYDNIASKYVEVTKGEIGKPIIDYTFYKCMLQPLLDDNGLLTGKRVLDLACGEGVHTRRLKALDCAYILGVDISTAMIELARQTELQNPQHIEYMVADVKQLPIPEQSFDLVTAVYLLNYAKTREELLQMAKVIYAQLGESKQFISVTINATAGQDVFDQRKYGVMMHTKVPIDGSSIPDGTELIITLYNERDEPACTFSNYYLSSKTYEEVFKEAGFKSFQWVPFQCDPDAHNKAFYDDFINSPDLIGVIAIK
jgi:ubiquinone/menaquinone biosynthesis C-methylase UbiE